MLPYLDQRPIFDAFNFNLSPDIDPANFTGAGMFVAAFLCPSDTAPAEAQLNYAMHNYLLNVGTSYSVVQRPVTPLMDIPNGFFFENSTTSPALVNDGLSSTVAITETIRSVPNVPFDPLNGFVITGNNKTTGPPITNDTDYINMCVNANPPPGFQVTRGSKWHYGAPGHSMYNHRRVPNDKRVDCRGGLPHSDKSDPLWSQLSLNVTGRSKHPGGVNSLFGDGHVQFIKESIAVDTWQALGTRSGGEVIGADSY
jgi:prepilin-type processing-associated H-X9-DG protein